MTQKVNLKTIAKDLNLSPSTISRVLNKKAKQFRISDETVETILKYVKEKGYSPNMVARGLQASKTFTIGLMIPDISNPFFALMARYIEKAASKANYSILLVDAEEDTSKEKKQIKNMISRKVDGIIAAPVGTSFEHFSEITSRDIPLVFVDRYSNETGIPFVTSDNYMGGYLATNLFIQNGHKQIALIKGDEMIEPVKERKLGYINALKDAGIELNDHFIIGDAFSIENGYQSTLKLFNQNPRPSAILAMSNLIGLGVLEAIKETKLIIPDDLSLIIYDDQSYVSYLNPPITTVKQDSERIGAIAIDYILNRIEKDPKELISQKIPVTLIERQSVKNNN